MCELCRAEKRTRWYYEDDVIWIADCQTCGTPMVVSQRHKPKITDGEWVHVHNVIQSLFGIRKIRTTRRQIPDHWHIHVLDVDQKSEE